MARIFISYCRKDQDIARCLASDLDRLGADVWVDVDDIPAGMKWSTAIQQGLDTCEVMIVVISPDSMASVNVEDEWQAYLDDGKPIIPVLWRPARVQFQLRRIQYIDFHNQDYDAAFAQLHSQLRRKGIQLAQLTDANSSIQIPAQKPLPLKSKGTPRRAYWITGGLVLLALAIIAGLILLLNDGDDDSDRTPLAPSPTMAVAQNGTDTLATEPTLSTFQQLQTVEAQTTQAVQTQTAFDLAATEAHQLSVNATGTAEQIVATKTVAYATMLALFATPTPTYTPTTTLASSETPNPTAQPTPTATLTLRPIEKPTVEAVAMAGADLGVIKVGTNAEYQPFEFVNEKNEIVGFDVDLLQAIATKSGFEIEMIYTRWDGIFVALQQGEFDAVASAAAITEEREKIIDFSNPYFNAGQTIAVTTDNPKNVQTTEDLPGLRVGVQNGTTGDIAVSEIDGVEVMRYDEIILAFQALANGDIDAIVNDGPVSADIIAQNPELGAMLVGDPFTDEFYGIGVREDFPELLNVVNDGLAAIIADGTYNEIYNKWFGMDAPSAFRSAKAGNGS